jgi:hypothetical protein
MHVPALPALALRGQRVRVLTRDDGIDDGVLGLIESEEGPVDRICSVLLRLLSMVLGMVLGGLDVLGSAPAARRLSASARIEANRASTVERTSLNHCLDLASADVARSRALAMASAMDVLKVSRWLSSFARSFARAAVTTSSAFFDRAARSVSWSDKAFHDVPFPSPGCVAAGASCGAAVR